MIWRRMRHFEKIVKAIDEQKSDLVELCLQLGNTPSHHARERRLGEAVLQWLAAAEIKGELQFITAESVNAVATLPGAGDGKSLIWNAHMDTGPEPGPDATEDEKKLETAWVDGDMLFGKGMINDKAQLCAFMIAMRAIKQCGIKLKGDLTLTAVAFETGDPSVGAQQGINFPGEGFGTKWVVDRGVVADYALGRRDFWLRHRASRVRRGAGSRFGSKAGRFTRRAWNGASSIQENPNAFVKAAHAIMAIEEWAVDYEKRETMEFAGGTIIPKAQIVEVRGGGKVSRPNPFCDIFIDVRIVPEQEPQRDQAGDRRYYQKIEPRLRSFVVSVFQRIYRAACRTVDRCGHGGAPIHLRRGTAGAAVGRNQHVARSKCFQRSRYSVHLLRSAAATRSDERRGQSRHEDCRSGAGDQSLCVGRDGTLRY